MTDVFQTRLVTQHQHTDRKLDCCASQKARANSNRPIKPNEAE